MVRSTIDLDVAGTTLAYDIQRIVLRARHYSNGGGAVVNDGTVLGRITFNGVPAGDVNMGIPGDDPVSITTDLANPLTLRPRDNMRVQFVYGSRTVTAFDLDQYDVLLFGELLRREDAK